MEVCIVAAGEDATKSSDAVVSIRAGGSRRQGALQIDKKLHFPVGIKEAVPFKVDLLRSLGTVDIDVGREGGIFSMVLEPTAAESALAAVATQSSMNLTLRVANKPALCGRPSLPTSPTKQAAERKAAAVAVVAAASGTRAELDEELTQGAASTVQARRYLDDHNVMRLVQALLEALIREQPKDPFEYIAEFMDLMSSSRAGAPTPALAAGKVFAGVSDESMMEHLVTEAELEKLLNQCSEAELSLILEEVSKPCLFDVEPQLPIPPPPLPEKSTLVEAASGASTSKCAPTQAAAGATPELRALAVCQAQTPIRNPQHVHQEAGNKISDSPNPWDVPFPCSQKVTLSPLRFPERDLSSGIPGTLPARPQRTSRPGSSGRRTYTTTRKKIVLEAIEPAPDPSGAASQELWLCLPYASRGASSPSQERVDDHASPSRASPYLHERMDMLQQRVDALTMDHLQQRVDVLTNRMTASDQMRIVLGDLVKKVNSLDQRMSTREAAAS